MATKRKTTRLRRGEILDVEEYHDGRYGAPGMPRRKKRKPTKEEMQRVNDLNRTRKCRLMILQYYDPGDYFLTWTYRVTDRPEDMAAALKDFQKAIRWARDQYRKRGSELRWIRNIERGTKGAWHIHLIANRIPGAADILEEAWSHGGTYITEIKKSPYYDEDFSKLASYITKNETRREKKADGTPAKSRIREANYNHSRNMQLPKPSVDKLVRWKKEVKSKKGYYIAKIHEGINPVTGYKYRRYTMIRLHRRI